MVIKLVYFHKNEEYRALPLHDLILIILSLRCGILFRIPKNKENGLNIYRKKHKNTDYLKVLIHERYTKRLNSIDQKLLKMPRISSKYRILGNNLKLGPTLTIIFQELKINNLKQFLSNGSKTTKSEYPLKTIR